LSKTRLAILRHARTSGHQADMPRSPIPRLVEFCTRRAWLVIAVALALSCVGAFYTATHFRMATDIKELFPRNLPWVERAWAYIDRFPQEGIVVVVDAPTPELVDQASAKLAASLETDHQHFRAVEAVQSDPFFAREALLYPPKETVEQIAGHMAQAKPLIQALSADPSLRGALTGLDYGLLGAANGYVPPDSLAGPMNRASDTLDDLLAGRPAHFSWRLLAQGKQAEGKQAEASDLRRFIQVQPVLDYASVEPGRAASEAIQDTARKLDLSGAYQARVRLTGLVPMNDSQFSVLQEHAVFNGLVTLAAVLLILWLALRSWKLILATSIGLGCGLAIAAALGLLLVGTLNPISVAFFVLFVGLGIDFGLQFAVRYRAERFDTGALRPALVNAARKAGGPLALAGIATALGFFSFVPTSYRGLSELGLIAGCGMIVAFLTSITLVPALIAVLNPPAEGAPMRMAALAPVDRFLERHRFAVVGLTIGAVVLGAPLLYWLRFDFNPLHLQSPKAEAVATFLELRKDPRAGANAAELLKPDLQTAEQAASRLARLPEVADTQTIASFIPSDQEAKIAAIEKAAAVLEPALHPTPKAPPTDGETVAALRETATMLAQFAATHPGPGAEAATRLSGLLTRLAAADPEGRARAATAFAEPLRASLAMLDAALHPEPITIATLPEALRRAWLSPDGEVRVQVLPKGDPDDTAVLRRFVTAVLAVEPGATGPAVMLYEAGNTILHAFIEAGVFAIVSIFVLLWIALRRLHDVAVALVPLLMAALLTLELSVAFDMPLNFANIIALPLLLGVGVAFKIYYVTAWRRGMTGLVQSTLTRAVMFSALTTATAFGSLSLSSHPGTASMGHMMLLALFCTMTAAVLFQPALMGPPRKVATETPTPRGVSILAEEDEDEFEPVARGRGRTQATPEHQREDETVSR
jgi:hopanoid biosynthesis associated RND transporter like protein HpnN